jgi:hypothetical protein
MPRCIERFGTIFLDNGTFTHDDRPTTYERLEAIVGHRLDHRKRYALIEGQVAEVVDWTACCSGCEGSGCHECGYHGKIRASQWVPLILTQCIGGQDA